MKLVVFFILFVTVSYSNQEKSDGSTVKLVHVFFRHGARTPQLVDMYPTDPYKLKDFLPMGWGQLTNLGKKQSFNLGKMLRERYGSFLGDIYTPEIVHARSTDFDRTKMTAMLVLAGLFPPAPSQLWNEKLPWQPIPVEYEKNDMDYTLRRPNAYCPAYMDELTSVLQSDKVRAYLKEKKKVLEYISEHTKKPINKLVDVFGIFQALTAEHTLNMTLPEWTKSVFPEELSKLVAAQCEFEVHTTLLKRLIGGRIMSVILENMLAKSTDSLLPHERKIYLYSAHEINVVNVLALLNLYEVHFPEYSSSVIIELHYLEDKQQYAVKVLYIKNSLSEPQEQEIPGCGVLCPLDNFVQITKPYIPLNYTAECNSEINLDINQIR